MILSKQQQIFTYNFASLILFIFDKGYTCTQGETYRTPEQAAIYAKTGKGIKNSLHCKRLAADLNLFSPEGVYLTETAQYKWVGDYWKTLNPSNRWGGDFKLDGNHFSMSPDGVLI